MCDFEKDPRFIQAKAAIDAVTGDDAKSEPYRIELLQELRDVIDARLGVLELSDSEDDESEKAPESPWGHRGREIEDEPAEDDGGEIE